MVPIAVVDQAPEAVEAPPLEAPREFLQQARGPVQQAQAVAR